MSLENVENIRQGFEAFNRGDLGHVLDQLSEDVVTYRGTPFGDTFTGKDGFLDVAADWVEGFADWSVTPEEFIEAGDQVVVRVAQEAHGEQGGAPVTAVFWFVYTLRDGQIVRLGMFAEKAEALEAAGLSEWENAEQRGLADAGFAALNSGDLEAFLALTAEDVEFTSMVAEAEGTTFRGHDGVRAWWETVRGAFRDPRWEVLDVRGSGGEGIVKFRLVGTLAGVEVAQTMWQAAAIREGKLAWWAFFRTEREALEAMG